MTIYEKELCRLLDDTYAPQNIEQTVEYLSRAGVIDYTRCKALVVRRFVERLTLAGAKKIDAMFAAAEEFACSYEYVRKCVYYFRDVNL